MSLSQTDAARSGNGCITAEDVDVISALNYTAMAALSAGAAQTASDIVDGTVAAFGRVLPALICRYATRVVIGYLGPLEAEAALDEVFTAEEQSQPLIRLIRLSIVLTQQAKLAGLKGKVEQARAELEEVARDQSHNLAIRERADELLRRAPQLDQVA